MTGLTLRPCPLICALCTLQELLLTSVQQNRVFGEPSPSRMVASSVVFRERLTRARLAAQSRLPDTGTQLFAGLAKATDYSIAGTILLFLQGFGYLRWAKSPDSCRRIFSEGYRRDSKH